MKNKAYITYIATDDYLVGVLTLYESLLRTKTPYPFYCLVTERVSPETVAQLSSYGVKIIHSPVIELPQNLIDYNTKFCHKNQEVLENYFQKLIIFGLEKFEKLVYLDTDMILLKNIDDLFEKPHMAGAVDNIEDDYLFINGGLIVIEPSKELYRNFIKKIEESKEEEFYEGANRHHRCFWDTDFYNFYYPEWGMEINQVIDIRYNSFVTAFKHYKGVFTDEVKLIHLTGKKPWLMTIDELYHLTYKNKVGEGPFLEKYIDILFYVLRKINAKNFNEKTTLCHLMEKYGSDKSSYKHNYTRFYEQVMRPYKDKKIHLFELGIGSDNPEVEYNMGESAAPGASLYAWRDYFPNGLIHGADIDKNVLFQDIRIDTQYCDQKNGQDIENMFDYFGVDFDFIILDGAHDFESNKIFFEYAIHRLKKSGFLFIEDLEYVKDYEYIIPLWEKKYPDLSFTLIDLYTTELNLFRNNIGWSDNNLLMVRYKDLI